MVYSCKGPYNIDKIPWKGGSNTNPDYDIRKMAPPNGCAVLFLAKCCHVKLFGWVSKKGTKLCHGFFLNF